MRRSKKASWKKGNLTRAHEGGQDWTRPSRREFIPGSLVKKGREGDGPRKGGSGQGQEGQLLCYSQGKAQCPSQAPSLPFRATSVPSLTLVSDWCLCLSLPLSQVFICSPWNEPLALSPPGLSSFSCPLTGRLSALASISVVSPSQGPPFPGRSASPPRVAPWLHACPMLTLVTVPRP